MQIKLLLSNEFKLGFDIESRLINDGITELETGI